MNPRTMVALGKNIIIGGDLFLLGLEWKPQEVDIGQPLGLVVSGFKASTITRSIAGEDLPACPLFLFFNFENLSLASFRRLGPHS